MPGIIKERLFTPGPTPLLMEAQLRALTMTLHHRTDAFRALMRETLESLQYYFNTKNDIIVFSSSGTGAMEGAVSNLLSPGDRVLIGTAGKFGERWVQIAKAYGIESVVVEAPYGHPVPISEMKKHLETGKFRAVFIQATESSTGVRNDVEIARADGERAAGYLLRRGCHHGAGNHRYSPGRVGHRPHDRRLAESHDDSAGPGVCQRQRKGLEDHRTIQAAALLLRLRQGTQDSRQGRIELHAGCFAGGDPARRPDLHQATGPRKSDRQRRACWPRRHARRPSLWASRLLR